MHATATVVCRLSALLVLSTGCTFVWMSNAQAQGRGGPEWVTVGGDAQRSSWVRSDPKISVEHLQKPGFGLAWKIKLNSEPTLASTLDRYIGYRGFRSYAFVGSASGTLTTIDSDLGRTEWQKKIAGGSPQASGACPGGMTANLARATNAAFPAAPQGRGGGGGGRGGPAKSAAGEPLQGAVTIQPVAANADAGRGGGRGGRGGRGAAVDGVPGAPAPPRAPGGRMPTFLHAISMDGMFHSMYVSNGEEPEAPVAFLPANANAHQLTVVDNIAYATTTQGCGGVPNGVWALDIASKKVVHWSPATGDIAGSGFAFGPDATVYAAAGSDLVGLDPKTLAVKSAYRAAGQTFTSAPIVFEFKDKAVVAAASQDGQLHLLDAQSLTGSAFKLSAASALATWQDPSGTRWILAPSKTAIAAWKVADQDGKPSLQPGWTSPELGSPQPPIVVNGVVFVASNAPSAVLHALDGATGKELWNSGKTMTAAVRAGGLSGSGSQLYLGTSDGMLYAFGFPIEH